MYRNISIMNQNKKLTLGILLTFIICIGSAIFAGYSTGPYGNYPNPGHHPGEIGPGTFNASNSTNPYWSFPGKVGIGTTNPDKILTVKRDSTSVDPATTDSVIKIINTANANDGLSGIIFSGSDWTDRAAGIFTRWGNDDARDGNILFWTGKNTGSGQEFTEKARITKDGNVGIGTDSPDEKLHVAGNAKIEGNLNVGGNTTLKATAIDGDLNMNTNKITNLATPTSNSDAATKGYVDAAGVGSGGICYTNFGQNTCHADFTAVLTGYTTVYVAGHIWTDATTAAGGLVCSPVTHAELDSTYYTSFATSCYGKVKYTQNEPCAICCKY